MHNDAHKDSEKLWNWAFHEDSQFDTRLQSFLTAHTLMLTAAGFVLSQENPSKGFLFVVAVFGILFGVVWFFVQSRISQTVKKLENMLSSSDSLFNEVFPPNDRRGQKWIGQTTLIARVLPLSVTFGWIIFICWIFTLHVQTP